MIWLIVACSDETTLSQKSDGVADINPQEENLPEVEENIVDILEDEPEQAQGTRQLKRMSIGQVRDAMEQITGVRWGDASRSNWDVYSDTLGVADYQTRVTSDRSPSVMFQKFLDDAAVETCDEWLQQADSSFFIIDKDVTAREDVLLNIRHARWLIQGKARTHTPIVDDYAALFFTVLQRTAAPDLAWQAVCVASFTHPDFFMY